MVRARAAFAALLLAAPAAALAGQPPAPAPAPSPAPSSAPSPWQVDWGQHYCSMIRHAGEGRPFATAFVVVPGGLSTEIMLIPEGPAALPRRIDRAVLMPGGRVFELAAQERRRGGRPMLSLSGPDFAFRDLLAGASELRLQQGDDLLASIPLAGSRGAVAAHRRCTAAVSRQWRADEAALAALAQLPDSTNALGFRPEDYPTGALAARTQGRVGLRITVTPEGHAGDCAVVVPSGSAAIDARSCQVVMRRARFRSARDRAGRAVAVPVIFTVTLLIPGAG